MYIYNDNNYTSSLERFQQINGSTSVSLLDIMCLGGIEIKVEGEVCLSMLKSQLNETELECIGSRVLLSPEMSFNIICLYRPLSADKSFYEQFYKILKECDQKKTSSYEWFQYKLG